MIDGIPNRPLYFYQKDIIGYDVGTLSSESGFLQDHRGYVFGGFASMSWRQGDRHPWGWGWGVGC